MTSGNSPNWRRFGRPALLFVTIGLLLYAAAYWTAEQLAYRTGHMNPLFKIATLEPRQVDWVILGASHAMPLDFDAFNDVMQDGTGARIINLASPGTGPLYNRLVLQRFLATHGAANLLYVVDSFAFGARDWNEDRFADSKLLARTPFDAGTAQSFAAYCLRDGVDWRAWLDYVSGFSKLNNRDRFERDVWTGETQFDRVYRPSGVADRQRIDYLYPNRPPDPAIRQRYLNEFAAIIVLAREHGMRVQALKMPAPSRFRALLPNEPAFDAALAEVLRPSNVPLHDLSAALDEPKYYFDTDHLNRAGATALFEQHLKAILAAK